MINGQNVLSFQHIARVADDLAVMGSFLCELHQRVCLAPAKEANYRSIAEES
jgi:hypothetical protein